MKVLYIGAGLHLQPLDTFKECKDFVFIDSLPINEYGVDYDKSMYCKNFIKDLLHETNKYSFNKVNETVVSVQYDIDNKYLNPTCFIFNNKDRRLIYYVSTGLPKYINNEHIQKDISNSDTLIISGHHPNNCFLKYMSNKINLVYYSKTWIPKTIEELKEQLDYEENIFYDILTKPEMILSERYIKYNDLL
jgi:hypothetical protein